MSTVLAEIKLQSNCFQWAWNEMPMTRRLLFHVPNGGNRSRIEASQLKASGVVAGVPDLLFIWHGRVYAFELKTEIGVVRPEQKSLHEAWAKQGVSVVIIRTFEDFQKIIRHIVGGGQVITGAGQILG